MIPIEAVDAAAKALRPTMDAMQPAFEKADMQLVVDLNYVAHLILEAAAPHMLAGAWDDGAKAGEDNVWAGERPPARNPYTTSRGADDET